MAHLEFSHNKESNDFTWDNVDLRLPRTDKLRLMVREGIPHSLRPQLWMRFSGDLNYTFFLSLQMSVECEK